MKIKHNDFSPIVQSVAIIPKEGEPSVLSSGVMLQGIHDFKNIMQRKETIKVTYGSILINGCQHTADTDTAVCNIEPGETVTFTVIGKYAAYLCTFPGLTE